MPLCMGGTRVRGFSRPGCGLLLNTNLAGVVLPPPPPPRRSSIWLALKNKVWTAERLAKRGLPHPASCPLCDQEAENIQHLLFSCVFTKQVWFLILQGLGLSSLPQPEERNFMGWWSSVVCLAPKNIKDSTVSLS
jgi:hypothetical protein